MIKKNMKIKYILILMISVYFIAICMINFSGNPVIYNPDMICDMNYSAKAWEGKSIFPEGWVFGNQLYAVATPVIASICYGLLGNQTIAMGMASTLMTIAIVLSFDWMIKSAFRDIETRLIGIFVLLAVVLYSGDAIYEENGWQLLFTMCSYYACYAINAFLAFGCYLNSDKPLTKGYSSILIVTGILSLGTGLQSTRQIAVMVGSLVFVELCATLKRWYKKEKIITKSFCIAAVISAINLSGRICAYLLDVQQVEIIGKMSVIDFSEVGSSLSKALQNLSSVFFDTNGRISAIIIVLVLIILLAYVVYKIIIVENKKALITVILLSVSVGCILFIDIFTELGVREIYYFMCYPLVAYAALALYSSEKKIIRGLILSALIVYFGFSCRGKISTAYEQCNRDYPNYEPISEYLEENSITTIYTAWHYGGEILIEADWSIEVGFFDTYNTFKPIKYLCNPEVFEAESSECAYIFNGIEQAEMGIRIAEEKGLDMRLMKYFPECDYYVYTSDVNIIKLFEN